MFPEVVNGLPLHILLVHVVVIVLPAAALLTVLGAVWPALRRKLGVLTPIIALIGLVSVPLATHAGEWLLQRVNPTPLIDAHVVLGDTLLPWAVGQFLLATAIWAWYRWFAAPQVTPAVPERRASGNVLHGEDPYAPTRANAHPVAPARARAGRTPSVIVSIAAIVVALVLGTGTIVKVVQIGESGSTAVWQGSFSTDPAST